MTASAMNLNPKWCTLSVIERLGLYNPTPVSFYMLAVAYLAYHGFRNEYEHLYMEARRNKDYETVHLTYMTLAKYHWRDLCPSAGAINWHTALPNQ